MRSRYSAFVKRDGEYLVRTQSAKLGPATPEQFTAPKREWLGLKVVKAAGDEVEFEARFLDGANCVTLHETSQFEFDAGRWVYAAGDAQWTQVNVGRNDPCPCGSGKKFKSCHA